MNLPRATDSLSELESLKAALDVLRDQWRQQATLIDTFHATMGTGYKVCADELDALLTGAGDAP